MTMPYEYVQAVNDAREFLRYFAERKNKHAETARRILRHYPGEIHAQMWTDAERRLSDLRDLKRVEIKPDKLGYDEDQVREILWRAFCKWMEGQTFGQAKDGTFRYYVSDVERFAGWRAKVRVLD